MAGKTNQGGAQPGAGRPTGHRGRSLSTEVLGQYHQALQLTAQTPTQPLERSKAVKIAPDDPLLLRVIRMRAQGRSWKAIAAETGHDDDTCQRWCSAYPTLVQAAIDDLEGVPPKRAFAHLAPATMAAFEDLLEPETPPAVRLGAAQTTAAYLHDKPRVVSESHVQVAPLVHIVFEG